MSEKKRNIIAFSIIVMGILFVVYGIYRGEIDVVLRKAVNICLECIGIG
ncbi:MAG: thioredoxin [Ruminococcaceae bacterium]|nr:thioredoxin [Oscillospiraceae bacterium]